ncbi:MAG: hypothetical protein IPL32_03545 [Chloracidobacterium sp.]|nr:hypothetical protein [Chloracidobacterium sp.]
MILGINTSHDVSYCLLDTNGGAAWLLEEERFNRFKHTDFFSFHGLTTLIEDGELKPEQVTCLSYSFEIDETVIEQLKVKCEENVLRDFGDEVKERTRRNFPDPEPIFSTILGLGRTRDFTQSDSQLRKLFPGATIESHNHHLSHAASAYYPSPFMESAVLVVDGAGRLETATIWMANKEELTLVEQIELPHSIGVFYWIAAHLLGLDEGKLMGLASYGNPRFASTILDKVISIEAEGGFRFQAPLIFWSNMSSDWACEEFLRHVPIHPRLSSLDPLTQEHADFAASVQLVTEKLLLHMTKRCQLLTDSQNLCLAGGVMQNCVALGRLICSDIFKEYWIQPASHDAGSAWGAALLSGLRRGNRNSRQTKDMAFLGRSITNSETEMALSDTKIPAVFCENPAEIAAEALRQGAVIGWARGRAEVGPRALGGRSLLAHPRFELNHFRLNQIKKREQWRPLAPVFREIDLHRFVNSGSPSPHMNLSFSVKPGAFDQIPAAVHVDGTARIQTVKPHDPGGLSSILQLLNDSGEVPCILNTSFNGQGEPLIQSPLEALRFFVTSHLDILFLGDWVIQQTAPLSEDLKEALTANSFLEIYRQLLAGHQGVILKNSTCGIINKQAQMLANSLEWAGLAVRVCEAADLESVYDSEERTIVFTFAPVWDMRYFSDSIPCFQNLAKWALVSDNLYPTLLTFLELQSHLESNLRMLSKSIAGRRCVVWLKKGERELFSSQLPDLVENIFEISDSPIMVDRNKDFLLISWDLYKENIVALRGYRPRQDYMIWVSRDSDIHRP